MIAKVGMYMSVIQAQSINDAERILFLDAMAEEYERKNEGWRVVLVDFLPPVTLAKEKVYMGASGHTYTKSKVKYILRSRALNFGYGYLTPSQLVRDWLAVTYPKRRARMNRYQKEALITHKPSPPLFAVPDAKGTGAYIDIKSAYWSILRRVGWACEYMPGRFLGRVGDVRTFPAWENKLARNTLVSNGLPGQVPVWTGERFATEKIGGAYLNLMLWGVVQHILNGVAADMVSAGAVYVMTDGYIVPHHRIGAAVEVLESWGLPYGYKGEGVYHVKSAGAYTIAHIKAGHYDRVRPAGINKINAPHADFLRRRLLWCATKIEPLLFHPRTN